ncbi:MAG TPA: sigma-70 family RNA polymerase sigma factor [Gaiellaceae bacterium]|nr:sigma-70 family RNA polymerase sigma factor [Gaiellaceae bacterium]
MSERQLLEAACGGDEDAFRRLVEPHRAGLHAHCYRMLGSLHDAEDALQEALLRAWRGLCGFDGRSSLRRWLYRITTNACLDALARRPKRVLPIDYAPPVTAEGREPGEPQPEQLWVEPYPDDALGLEDGYSGPAARYEQREAVELAFVAALQHLPPRQRAVLILREVLGFSAKEVAESFGATVASVNSALQRARRAVDERLPEHSQQATIRSLGDEGVREIVQDFVAAFERGDVEAIVSLLTEDATFTMPPYQEWYRGRDAIADSWLMPGARPSGLRYLPTQANGQPAVGAYALDPTRRRYVPIALDVLTLRGRQVAAVTAFRNPELFPRFGLPDELAA